MCGEVSYKEVYPTLFNDCNTLADLLSELYILLENETKSFNEGR